MTPPERKAEKPRQGHDLLTCGRLIGSTPIPASISSVGFHAVDVDLKGTEEIPLKFLLTWGMEYANIGVNKGRYQ